ncbi:MAG: type II toxin-antitoxin system HicB family antitoxin [bacterium]|jgi:predicted RNase H-like HicB family nuclease
MKGTVTVLIEACPEGGYWASCLEFPGANGQGETIEDTKQNLKEAIQLLLEDRLLDFQRGLPEGAILEELEVS